MRVAAAAVASFAALAMTASPAHADSNTVTWTTPNEAAGVLPAPGEDACGQMWNSSGNALAEGCFYHYGDRVYIADHRSDGLRAIIETDYNYARANDECHEAGGAGSSRYCNYNMREDGKVRFRLLTRDGASGPNVHVGEWSPWLRIGDQP
ncbi:hypothetical protein ACFQ61_33685 [Streptomyces sp. NPDC056500]|uniref:hypothetical protein n=1 Tax=Streptomyces sp. NPDC056500 TaxID=3345840 RepID=UPI0036A987FD